MAENITRCPKCYTSFRISDAHLNTEKGAVRCGSCLNIFNAKQNLISVSNEVAAAEPKKPDQEPAVTPQIKQTKAHQQPAKISAQDDSAAGRKQEKQQEREKEKAKQDVREEVAREKQRLETIEREKRASREKEKLWKKELEDAKHQENAQRPSAPDKVIEKASAKGSPAREEDAISDDILISDDMGYEEDKAEQKAPYIDSDVAEAFDESIFSSTGTGEYEFNLFERESSRDKDEEENQADESWALDLLENDDEDDPRSTPVKPTPEEDSAEDERHTTAEFEASYYKNSITPDEEPAPKHNKENQTKPQIQQIAAEVFDDYEDMDVDEYDYSDDAFSSSQSATSSHYLDAIEPEPVEFDWQRHSTIWDSKLLWGGGSLLIGLLLFGQIAWIKFDSLSVVEPYRAYYAKACKIFSCTLPVLIDRSKIRTTNLVVRSHPTEKNALIVDAVLQNTAKFAQSFPALDLVFTNNQDKIVAARRLLPDNYLTGELIGRTHMPIKQPIHVSIEIVDPGSEAIGYKISIAD